MNKDQQHAFSQLQTGVSELKLTFTAKQLDTLMAYLDLIQYWNKIHNLTAIRNLNDMVVKHLLDSLVIVPYMAGQRLIDVGSGAGLPGIPLAVYFPDKHVALLDSNGKKAQFLQLVKEELHLQNVEIVRMRSEQYQPERCYKSVITRAFSNLSDIVQKTLHLCCQDGIVFAMKGSYPQEEIANLMALPLKRKLNIEVVELQVPLLVGQRHLVMLSREDMRKK